MNLTEVLYDVNEIFKHILENNTIVVTRETNSDDIDDWDSLNHMHLVAAIEKYFNIKFTAAEMLSYNNVGEICDAIIFKKS